MAVAVLLPAYACTDYSILLTNLSLFRKKTQRKKLSNTFAMQSCELQLFKHYDLLHLFLRYFMAFMLCHDADVCGGLFATRGKLTG